MINKLGNTFLYNVYRRSEDISERSLREYKNEYEVKRTEAVNENIDVERKVNRTDSVLDEWA